LANKLLSERIDYPIHLGVTEAGEGESAIIKSSIGVGSLLSAGIGDTVRVSLTDEPVKEVAAALSILRALGIREGGMDIVGCPTCGRTKIDLITLMRQFKERAEREGLTDKKIKVAIMGCVVNGPGEAREADVGIAGGEGEGLIFAHGEIIGKVKEERLIDALIDEIKKIK
ncbi:MAG: flavodoxin-dependent (E)-4-hydroxy-3-methylbut-2-enyl-diphosphate synthase, partial [Clostridia bacterium]|nr:flavodoxin-dependent (E)-4-hydroxy-3-methylbut-2-enyl-diphosphate synthase [Clostridia bacterium]